MLFHEEHTQGFPTMDFATGEPARITEGFDYPLRPYSIYTAEQHLAAVRGRIIARFLDDLASSGYECATLTRIREAEGLDIEVPSCVACDQSDLPLVNGLCADCVARCPRCGETMTEEARCSNCGRHAE